MTQNRPSVLIIDDDEQFSLFLCELLSQNGFSIQTARNGKLGIDELRIHHADVILLDLVMPEMDGIEAIQTIKSTYPVIPIVTMSGGNQGPADVYLSVSEKLGAVKTLNKPFESTELLGTLRSLFPEHSFQDL